MAVRCAVLACRMVPALRARPFPRVLCSPTYQEIAATPGKGLRLLESWLQLLLLGNNGCPC